MAKAKADQLTDALIGPCSRRQDELETLVRAHRAVGTATTENALIDAANLHVAAAFDADRAVLLVHEPARRQLRTREPDAATGRAVEWRIADDDDVPGQVFHTHESLWLDDVERSARFDRQAAQRRGFVPGSVLAVPVMAEAGRCVGVLQVMDAQTGYFRQTDLPLLEAMAAQTAVALSVVRRFEAEQRQFESLITEVIEAIESRDPKRSMHSINVANYAAGIGTLLGLDESNLRSLRIAALLHDLGRIDVPDSILTKRDFLEPEETAIVQQHAGRTRQILARVAFTRELDDIAFLSGAHHEKLDGSGYPEGLVGNQIPLKVRILTVADIYHALTQDRYQRKAMPLMKAISLIDDMTPGQLDQRCVDALKRFLGIGPPPPPAA